MILQEKIQKKAEEYGQLAPAFLEGAKFALENQWIRVADRLPEIETDGLSTKVLVVSKKGKKKCKKIIYCGECDKFAYEDVNGYGFCLKTNEECRCFDKCHLTHVKP